MRGAFEPTTPERVVFVVAADHGVARRGVSAYPRAVTRQMIENFARGGAAVSVLAGQAGVRLVVVDAGVDGAESIAGVIQRRIRGGTDDMTAGPAMSRDEAERAVRNGIELGRTLEPGTIVGLGEMGIGNTTSAAAITALVCGVGAEAVTGRGTGVADAAYARKVEAVARAIEVNHPDPADGIALLAGVGGFEVGTLAGIAIAAASRRCAVVLDGYVSTAAGLIAVALQPEVRPYLLASHLSTEPGHRLALDHLGLSPLLSLGMRLGEGTGSVLAIQLIDAALALLREMATFEEAGVSDGSEAMEAEQ